MKQEYLTNNPSQTKKIGKVSAQKVIKKPHKKRAFIIGLVGDLGGGKTTFLQGFAKGLGIKQKILSPTFVIMRKFKIPKRRRNVSMDYRFFKDFYHIDCYRVKKTKEILNLGFKEVVSNPFNIVVIEWADRIRKVIPKDATWVKFEFISDKKRKIMIK